MKGSLSRVGPLVELDQVGKPPLHKKRKVMPVTGDV